MSCPLNRNRLVGSGYQKPSSSTNSELDAKMKQLLLDREKQDAQLYPQNRVTLVQDPVPNKQADLNTKR